MASVELCTLLPLLAQLFYPLSLSWLFGLFRRSHGRVELPAQGLDLAVEGRTS